MTTSPGSPRGTSTPFSSTTSTSTSGIARPRRRRDRLGVVVVAAHRRDAGRLGEAVAGHDRFEAELGAHAPDHLDGNRGRAGDREPQRRHVELGETRVIEDRLVHRRRPGQHRRRCSSAARAITSVDVEHRVRDDRRALDEARDDARVQAERVEERVDDRGSGRRRAARSRSDHASYARTVAACVSIAPFGRPVVPDVNRIEQRSSPCTSGSGAPASPREELGPSPRRGGRSTSRSDGTASSAREQRDVVGVRGSRRR